VLSLGYLALATRALGLEGFGRFVLAVSFSQAITGLASFQTWQAVVRWGHDRKDPSDAVGFALALDLVTVVAGAIGAGCCCGSRATGCRSRRRCGTKPSGSPSSRCSRSARRRPGFSACMTATRSAATADAVTPVVRLIGAVGRVPVRQDQRRVRHRLGRCRAGHRLRLLALRAALGAAAAAQGQPDPPAARGEGRLALRLGHRPVGRAADRLAPAAVLLVGALGGAALAGIYRVAAQLGEGLLKLAQALMRATYPELVRDPAAARAIAARIGRIAVITGVVTVAFGALAGHWVIIVIAGHEYLAAYGPMLILAGAAAIELAGAPLEALLVARGRALTNFLLRAVPTFFALLTLPLVVARGGANGAAAVVLIASSLSVAA
jgi:hypothetical protein